MRGILSLLFRGVQKEREKKKARKKAWPKERGQRASGAARGKKKGYRGPRGRSRTSRVIPRWNLVKQSSLETTRTRTLLGPPGCLIKIEVVRSFLPLEALSHTFYVDEREERTIQESVRRRKQEGTTTMVPSTHGCVFPLHGFYGEACVSSGYTCVLLVLFRDGTRVYIGISISMCARPSLRPSVHVRRARGARASAPLATSTVAIRFSDK